jgi:peptide/nickel transport system permease protein
MRTRLVHSLITVALTVLLGGLVAATLVRYAPGFGVDERELDARLSQESIRQMRAESGEASGPGREGILSYYLRYLARAATGDLGVSASFQRPIVALIAERLPETARSAGAGLACGWALGMLAALAAAVVARPAFHMLTGAAAALFLCLPSSVLALAFVLAGGIEGRSAAAGVISLVVFPRVFRYARAILGRVFSAPHVLMARAKGVGRLRLIRTHVLRPAAPAVIALLGVSVSVAFGAAIPIEVICDAPGLGQLAWQAALKRDLPLLIDITLLVSILAGVSGLAAEIARAQVLASESP